MAKKLNMPAYLIESALGYVVWIPTMEELDAARTSIETWGSKGMSPMRVAAYRVLHPIGTFDPSKVPPEPVSMRLINKAKSAWWLNVEVDVQTRTKIS